MCLGAGEATGGLCCTPLQGGTTNPATPVVGTVPRKLEDRGEHLASMSLCQSYCFGPCCSCPFGLLRLLLCGGLWC